MELQSSLGCVSLLHQLILTRELLFYPVFLFLLLCYLIAPLGVLCLVFMFFLVRIFPFCYVFLYEI